MKYSFLLIALSGLLIIGCGGDNSNSNTSSNFSRFGGPGGRAAKSVETGSVEVGQIAEQVRSFGNVKAQNIISVVPQVSNRVTQLYVDLGDSVKQGQALAKIHDVTYRDQLNQAQSQVAQARVALQRDSTEYERQKSLMVRDLTSAAELENAQAAYQSSMAQFESARSSLTQAREDFENTVVRSPVKGVVNSRSIEVGDLASTGTEMFQIASTNAYESRIYLPVQDWKAVKVGQEVNLRVSNEDGISAKGVVSRKSPQLDATTGLGEVVITLTQTGNAIYPGVLAESTISITTKEQALIVPRSALVEKVETVINPESNTIDLERTYSIFVSKGDSVAELRSLELGIEQGDRIEVLSGLLPSDNIIVTGQAGLDDGTRINVASGQQFQAPEQRRIESSGNQSPRNRNPLANMSEAQRAEARENMKDMNPEERRQYLQKLRAANSDSSQTNSNRK